MAGAPQGGQSQINPMNGQAGGPMSANAGNVDVNQIRQNLANRDRSQDHYMQMGGSNPAYGGQDVYGQASQGLTQAMDVTSQGTQFSPMAITAPSQATMGQYMNPYESQVVGQSLQDLERSRKMAQNVGGAQASQAGAFGGSRHGIAEAETNRAFADQAARTASGLRQSGYTQAQNLAQQAQMQNQQAQLSGAQQRLSAAGQLGNLSNLGFGMGQQVQQGMQSQGAMQQALQQQIINAAKGQYGGYTGAPADSLSYLLQAVGGSPQPTTTTSTSQPGLFDYLSLGLSL